MDREHYKNLHRRRREDARRRGNYFPVSWPNRGWAWLIAAALRDAGFERICGNLAEARRMVSESRKYRMTDWDRLAAETEAELGAL